MPLQNSFLLNCLNGSMQELFHSPGGMNRDPLVDPCFTSIRRILLCLYRLRTSIIASGLMDGLNKFSQEQWPSITTNVTMRGVSTSYLIIRRRLVQLGSHFRLQKSPIGSTPEVKKKRHGNQKKLKYEKTVLWTKDFGGIQ